MDENLNGFSEPQENVVDSQPIEQTSNTEQAVNADNGEITTPTVDNKPVQSAEENSKYAAIRREAEQKVYIKAQDDLIAQQYGKYGIYTKADYDKAVAAQEREQQIQEEAQKQGVSEDIIRRLKDVEDINKTNETLKNEYERKLRLIDEDASLRKDEKFSDYYLEHEAEIKNSANDFNVDLTTAMLLSIKDNFQAIKEGTTKKAQQETINNIIKNGQNSPGSVANGGNLPGKSIKDLSSTDFNKLREAALRGEVKEF